MECIEVHIRTAEEAKKMMKQAKKVVEEAKDAKKEVVVDKR